MNRRSLPLVAVLIAVAGCDFKETRSGQIVLTPAGSAGIPLNGKAGAASLVAGSAELTFKKGSSKNSIALSVKQSGRPNVDLEAAVAGDYTSGNFSVRGADIGQPVDMTSARAYAITGPAERYSNWEDQGNQTCMVDTIYEPCDENWTLSFRSANGVELGSFASRQGTRCNERRSVGFCRQNPQREPHIPDFPRGPRGTAFQQAGDGNVKFD